LRNEGFAMMDSIWRDHYRTALERAICRAELTIELQELIACGFTINLDRVVAFDHLAAERLFAGQTVEPPVEPVTRANSVVDLLTGIAQCVADGSGRDLPIRDLAVQEWLLDRVDGRTQIGGTGAQAAATLATLGFSVLLHSTGRTPEQIAGLPHRERIVVAGPRGLVPIEAVSDPADRTMWHVVLEFDQGLHLPLPGAPAAPAGNRVIISYDPVNADFTIDPAFSSALTDINICVSSLLVSGFSQVIEPANLERVLSDAAIALRAWRAARPDLLIHLELGAMPESRSLVDTLEVLSPLVSSVGCNIDELRQILAALDMTTAKPGPDLVGPLRWLARRFALPRLSLHTRDFCLTVTEGDAERERDALLCGSLVAGTRCRTGAFPEFADLSATLDREAINPVGLALLRALEADAAGTRQSGVVVTPGLRIASPVASVGMGDSFTAGVLALL
jgi:ADP-dependent phosphofructokinase/glucokinase